jgi:branched-chain amino acid transport system substrate-binding protein
MTNTTKWGIGAIIVAIVLATAIFLITRGDNMPSEETTADNVMVDEKETDVTAQQTTEPTEPIKIGAILPLTGPAAQTGTDMQKGLLLAEKEINTSDKKKIEFFFEDSAGSPKDGVAAFTRLENTIKPDIYISLLSSVAMAIKPLVEQNEVALLVGASSLPAVTQNTEYVWRYAPIAGTYTPNYIDLLDKADASTLGILYITDEYGKNISQELTKALANTDKTVISESFLPKDKDFRSQITKLKSQGAEVILPLGFTGHVLNIIDQATDLQFSGAFMGNEMFSNPPVTKKIDNAFATVARFYDPSFAPAQEFIKKYESEYNKTATHRTGYGYDVAMMIANSNNPDRQGIVSYLNSLNSHKGVLGSLQITPESHEMTYQLFPARIEQGELTYITQ